MNRKRASVLAAIVAALLALTAAACGGGDSDSSSASSSGDQATTATSVAAADPDAGDIRVVSPDEASEILEDPPANLTVLDVRTPEEFATGHLEGAVLLDFYSEDFATELADLDRDTPYVLYCRSGNRSGQTRAMMTSLEFADVADVDGGI